MRKARRTDDQVEVGNLKVPSADALSVNSDNLVRSLVALHSPDGSVDDGQPFRFRGLVHEHVVEERLEHLTTHVQRVRRLPAWSPGAHGLPIKVDTEVTVVFSVW